MVEHLWTDFLVNPRSYEAAQATWLDVVERIASLSGDASEWQAYVPRTYGGVKPIDLEELPIIDRWSHALGRAFQVLQHVPVDDKISFAAWVNSEPEAWTALPRIELVMNLALSKEALAAAEQLLVKWMNPQVDVSAVQGSIDTFNDRYRR